MHSSFQELQVALTSTAHWASLSHIVNYGSACASWEQSIFVKLGQTFILHATVLIQSLLPFLSPSSLPSLPTAIPQRRGGPPSLCLVPWEDDLEISRFLNLECSVQAGGQSRCAPAPLGVKQTCSLVLEFMPRFGGPGGRAPLHSPRSVSQNVQMNNQVHIPKPTQGHLHCLEPLLPGTKDPSPC